MVHRAYKFIVKDIFGRNSSPKVLFVLAKAATNSLPRRPPFLSVFKTSLRKVYQQLGTETRPVIGLNYVQFGGDRN